MPHCYGAFALFTAAFRFHASQQGTEAPQAAKRSQTHCCRFGNVFGKAAISTNGTRRLQCHGSLFPLWRAFTCFRPPSPSQPPRHVSPRPLPHTHRPEPEPNVPPPEASHEREFVSWRPFAPLVANPAPVEPHDDCWLNGRRRHARITLAAVTQNGFCSWYTSASPLFDFPRFTFSPYLLHSASHFE